MNANPRKFGRRYPWVKWFRRKSFTLTKGIDFLHRIDTMAQMVRNAASRLKVRVNIKISEDGNRLTAYPNPQEK